MWALYSIDPKSNAHWTHVHPERERGFCHTTDHPTLKSAITRPPPSSAGSRLVGESRLLCDAFQLEPNLGTSSHSKESSSAVQSRALGRLSAAPSAKDGSSTVELLVCFFFFFHRFPQPLMVAVWKVFHHRLPLRPILCGTLSKQ